MSDGALAENATYPRDHVVRGESRGLVDDENAIHGDCVIWKFGNFRDSELSASHSMLRRGMRGQFRDFPISKLPESHVLPHSRRSAELQHAVCELLHYWTERT